jgi:hypothetical protein
MSPTFYFFLIIGIVYYALAHHLTVIQRQITKLGEDIHKDIKHEIELHEVRTK